MISALAEREEVENVLLFVSDSHRFDSLPNSVAQMGTTFEGISASTFTASGLPSILTGQLPSSHRVWDFENRLKSMPPLLANAQNLGFKAENIWTDLPAPEKPPLKIHHVEDSTKLDELETPFVHVIHDKGGHSPYNETFEESAGSRRYFENTGTIEAAKRDYLASLESSADRFAEVIGQLKDRNVFDETLVVFCSDHGEFLGETDFGHIFGHGHPMGPPIVRVPIVFCGAGIGTGETKNDIISTADIAPTVMEALGWSPRSDIYGDSLWNDEPDQARNLLSEVWKHGEYKNRGYTKYAAAGSWADDGTGVVYHRHSRTTRILYALATHLKTAAHAPLTRSSGIPTTLRGILRRHVPSVVKYGKSETVPARSEIFRAFERPEQRDYEIDREQLEKLGYL